MKEATGELNMTLVTIIAIAAVLGFVTFFLPNLLNSVGDKWNNTEGTDCYVDQGTGQSCCRHPDGTTTCGKANSTTPAPTNP